MSPEECVDRLDSALAEAGEDIILRRIVGTGNNQINIDVKCRALARPWRLRAEQVAGDVSEYNQVVIISPTEIKNAQWPGGYPAGQKPVPSIPRKTDTLIIQGIARAPLAAEPILVNGVIVRIEFSLLG